MTEAASIRFTSDGGTELETLITEHMRLIAERCGNPSTKVSVTP